MGSFTMDVCAVVWLCIRVRSLFTTWANFKLEIPSSKWVLHLRKGRLGVWIMKNCTSRRTHQIDLFLVLYLFLLCGRLTCSFRCYVFGELAHSCNIVMADGTSEKMETKNCFTIYSTDSINNSTFERETDCAVCTMCVTRTKMCVVAVIISLPFIGLFAGDFSTLEHFSVWRCSSRWNCARILPGLWYKLLLFNFNWKQVSLSINGWIEIAD